MYDIDKEQTMSDTDKEQTMYDIDKKEKNMSDAKVPMLSRRQIFAGSSALAVAALGSCSSVRSAVPTSARAARGGRFVDMTHTLSADFPTYFGKPQFATEPVFNMDEHGFSLFNMTLSEHVGTHVDAPRHFSASGASVDEIPVENLIGSLCVIDIAARAAENADTQLIPADIKAWIAVNGEIPDGACVAMQSGWGAKVSTSAFRNFDGTAQHYPGFHVDAATMLIEETGAASIAVDTLSIDYGISSDFATHYAWLSSGRFGIESIANLDQVPAAGATIIIGAPKHRGGSGGPARIFAMM